jgi:hypothetical protein
MFVASYFAPRYFTGSYWTKLGVPVEVPIEPPMVVGGPPAPRPREIPFKQINVRAKGKILVVSYSLIPGNAAGGAKASGDFVEAINAVAYGDDLALLQWQMMDGAARSKIILTDEEEIMLILADAA